MARSSSEDSSTTGYTAAEEKLPFLDGNAQSDKEKSYSQQHEHHGPYLRRSCSPIYWPFILLFQFIFTVIIITVIVHRLSVARPSVAANAGDCCPNHSELLRPAVKYAVITPPGDWWERPLYTDLSTESGMAWHELLNRR